MYRHLGLAMAGLLLASMACTLPGVTLGSGPSIAGSGDIVTREISEVNFDRVEAAHSFTVNIVQGPSYGGQIRVDDNVEQYLIVERRGDTLYLGLEDGQIYSRLTLEAEIVMPALRGLELSGASDGSFRGFASTEPFDLTASGASSVRGEIQAGDTRIDLSGASDLRLAGSGGDLTLDGSGSSSADLEAFAVNDATLSLSAASEATVNAAGTLNVSASGASDVTYVGNPTLGQIDVSGASSLRAK